MQKALKWLAGILAGLILLTVGLYFVLRIGFETDILDQSGWKQTPEGIVCLDYRGDPLLQWQTIDGHTYYFSPEHAGAMVTGWLELDGQRYWLNTSGRLCTGWTDTDRGRFFFREDGTLLTGWYEAPEGTYYLDPQSGLGTGWLELEQKRYYLNAVGQLHTGWLQLEQEQYYFDESGVLQTGWLELDGKTHYLGEDGRMVTGWVDMEDGRRHFDESGVMTTGWYSEEENQYHFAENGLLHTGWLQLETGRYYLGDNGAAHTGWLELDGERYYFREDGSMAVGEVVLDGISHFFTSAGKYVVLVNAWHLMPEDYELNMTEVEGFQFDVSGAEALQKMLEDCRKAGYKCTIDNTYRSREYQQYLWNVGIDQRMAQGMSYEKAKEITGQRVAKVGASEHHLGLAVDLDGGDEWLAEHCWEYGFLLRYPEGKTEYTGIIFEPWHFRYVGTEFALELRDLGLCMEEYMTMLTESQS